MRHIKPIVWLIFIFSGASGLIYQVIWMRQLTLIFGSTVFATSTVLTAFMAGLALGSYYFGRKIDESDQSPLRNLCFVGSGYRCLLSRVATDFVGSRWLVCAHPSQRYVRVLYAFVNPVRVDCCSDIDSVNTDGRYTTGANPILCEKIGTTRYEHRGVICAQHIRCRHRDCGSRILPAGSLRYPMDTRYWDRY